MVICASRSGSARRAYRPASAPPSVNNGVYSFSSATDNLGRAEGYTELAGDVLLACTGGTPTAAGQPVPQITIQIFLSQNVTSKITAVTGSSSTGTSVFLEALLIIDEPNSSLHPNTPLLNCGYSTGALPDTSPFGSRRMLHLRHRRFGEHRISQASPTRTAEQHLFFPPPLPP